MPGNILWVTLPLFRGTFLWMMLKPKSAHLIITDQGTRQTANHAAFLATTFLSTLGATVNGLGGVRVSVEKHGSAGALSESIC
ncbi:hypothetical protein CAG70_03140 [Photobacterium halotolerans]|uniref:hypothetical protein n=1 Tax=Photobacterium halotolerans TaxID=265726 RepID=UPI0013734654|nr:hypothetical protein [Photobacterium halotolerans]NAX45997.1 hypothetical protein [Photobacterium halotolerans]